MSGLPSPNMASLAAMGQGMPNAVVNSQAMYGNSMNPNERKKAVHVKWAGKTIALGTFPHVEADEKCARAKALTRAWRSTMRPKPTREWVMLELERLQVRVVSGRIGRKGEDDDEEDEDEDDDDVHEIGISKGENGATGDNQAGVNGLLNGSGMPTPGDRGVANKNNGDSTNASAGQNGIPPHRPLVGGGSAAAYEAARADHYRNIAENAKKKKGDGSSKDNANDITNPMPGPLSQMKSKTGGVLGQNPVSMPQLGLTVNPNQHYEMLKLHHMNLLNEIQETTLMMNLYQQQQLQQQQQLTDQQPIPGPSPDQQLALQLAQQQQSSSASPFLESLYGMGASNPMNPSNQFPFMNQQASQFQQQLQQSNNQFGLGFGGSGGMGSANHQMHALLRQQQNMLSGGMNGMGMQNSQLKSKIDELKQGISDRQSMDKSGNNDKRNYPPQDYGGAKKQKKTK